MPSFQTSVPRMGTSRAYGQAHLRQVRDVHGRFAGGWGFAWQGLSQVSANVIDLNERIHQNLREAVDRLASDIEAYMKANAPWDDRSTDARNALQAVVVWEDAERFSIWLGHGSEIHYGIWLEVRWGGKYAIVVPTAHHFGPLLGSRIKGIS